MASDEKLERRIYQIMLEPAKLDVPTPMNVKHPLYGYAMHKCRKCGKLCLIRGGYPKHYVKAHAPDQARTKAKAIIAAVRKHDRLK